MSEALGRWLAALGAWALPALGVSAAIEYVFPPFPGDTITLLGAVTVVSGQLHPVSVLLAVTLGGAVGMAADWHLGAWAGRRLAARDDAGRSVWGLTHERMGRFEASYRRWGVLLIVANRFLPGVRALFFVAAGAAGISLPLVLALGALSGLLWNGLVLAIGYSLGANLGAIEAFFSEYTSLTWGLLLAGAAAAASGWAFRRWRRLRREGRAGSAPF